MLIEKKDNVLTVYLKGEIDHHSAPGIRSKIDSQIIKQEPKTLVLDFSQVSFMDSSAVGLVIGRYKTASANNCKTAVCGLRPRDEKILMMSGLQNKVEFR